jgi:hypothetical protein
MSEPKDYTIMQKAEAARAFINRVNSLSQEQAEDLELEAFMSIFHPKVYADRNKMYALRKAAKESRKK